MCQAVDSGELEAADKEAELALLSLPPCGFKVSTDRGRCRLPTYMNASCPKAVDSSELEAAIKEAESVSAESKTARQQADELSRKSNAAWERVRLSLRICCRSSPCSPRSPADAAAQQFPVHGPCGHCIKIVSQKVLSWRVILHHTQPVGFLHAFVLPSQSFCPLQVEALKAQSRDPSAVSCQIHVQTLGQWSAGGPVIVQRRAAAQSVAAHCCDFMSAASRCSREGHATVP